MGKVHNNGVVITHILSPRLCNIVNCDKDTSPVLLTERQTKERPTMSQESYIHKYYIISYMRQQ